MLNRPSELITSLKISYSAIRFYYPWLCRKSVKAALMLLPLLGIPNILQTIPFPPTKKNLTYFAIYTYVASFSYQFQGFFIAVLYCFTNREVSEWDWYWSNFPLILSFSPWNRWLRHSSRTGVVSLCDIGRTISTEEAVGPQQHLRNRKWMGRRTATNGLVAAAPNIFSTSIVSGKIATVPNWREPVWTTDGGINPWW